MPENKIVQLVISERGDFWMEDLEVMPDETLRQAITRRGYENFLYLDFDIDDAKNITDSMVVRIRLTS